MLFRRSLVLFVLVAVSVSAVSACRPAADPGWESLAYRPDGQPVRRSSCTVHYKVNADLYPQRGQEFGIDVVTEIHRAFAETGKATGTRWVFDGYTHATLDGRNGTRSAAAWALDRGVIVELRRDRKVSWSQPKPAAGPAYTGGVIWFAMETMRSMAANRDFDGIRGTIRHEIGHQYGLGDLYDSQPVGHSSAVRQTNRMGTSRVPWGPGDRAGLKTLVKRC